MDMDSDSHWDRISCFQVKSAPFMENIVNIYKNLDATFNANIAHPVCSDVKSVIKMGVKDSAKKDNSEIGQQGKPTNGRSMNLQTDMPTLLNCSGITTPKSGRKQEFKKSV